MFLAVLAVAVGFVFALLPLASASSYASPAPDARGSVTQPSAEVVLAAVVPRPHVVKSGTGTQDQTEFELLAVLVTAAAAVTLTARRHRGESLSTDARRRPCGMTEPRAPPVAPAI